MIPKSYRLTRSEIDALFTKSPDNKVGASRRQHHTDSFFVITQASKSFKAGVSVPKKVLPRAVDRNSVRRQVLDSLKETGFFTLSFHVLLTLKKGTAKISGEDIVLEVAELYKKITTSNN